MVLPYIRDGKLYDSSGSVIEKPSILIIEGKVFMYGSHGYLKFKKEMEGRKLIARGRSLMEARLIPLYELVDLEDCLTIIRLCEIGEKAFGCSSEEYSKFIHSLCVMSERRSFKDWVKRLKVS